MEILSVTVRHMRRWNLGNYEHREMAVELAGRVPEGSDPISGALKLRDQAVALVEAPEKLACVSSVTKGDCGFYDANKVMPCALEECVCKPTIAPCVNSNSPSLEEADPFSLTVEVVDVGPQTVVAEPKKPRGRPRKDASASPPAEPAVSAAPPVAAGEADPFASEPTPELAKPAAAKVISDKELLQAAQKLASQPEGFARVKALAEMFGAKSVVALAQEHRAAFLEQLGA